MCVAQGVSPGTRRRPFLPPRSAAEGGGTWRQETWKTQRPRVHTLGYTHIASLRLKAYPELTFFTIASLMPTMDAICNVLYFQGFSVLKQI